MRRSLLSRISALGEFFPVLALAFLAGCQSAEVAEKADSAAVQPSAEYRGAIDVGQMVYVVSNGWHTGIVLMRSDLPRNALPEVHDFPHAEYLEFSWGDAKYFPAAEKRLSMIMNALFTPTSAVLHLAGLPAHPRKVFPNAETVKLQVTSRGFNNLIGYLDDTFDRGSAEPSIPGLYRFSRFYPAKGRFHMFNTCNTWTARGLAAAGIPVTVTGTLQAEDLMAQLR